MSAKRQSWPLRFLGFVAFRLIPLILLVAIVIVGVGAAQQVARRVGEEQLANGRRDSYRATATTLAPTLATQPPDLAIVVERKGAIVSKNSFDVPLQDFVTNTPPPTSAMSNVVLPATNTPPAIVEPTAIPATETPLPTETPAVSATPRPLPTLLMPGNVDPRIVPPTAIPTQVPPVDRRGQDIMNVLLLGNDGELTEDGYIRTDTMIVVSVNRSAGTVSMLSLPRDLYVYMPGWTMQRLNVAYIHGESSGWTDGGFGLMRETLYYNLGINVHYYAMVNLTAFKTIVDALGGVNIAVDCALQDYPLYEAEVPAAAFRANEDGLMTLPVGYYHMNGPEALWYARSRGNSSDFDRGRRQQQVLRAIWRQARDSGQLASLPQLWAEASQYIQTNMPIEEVITLVPLALNLDSNRIESFTLRRLYDTTPWQPPSGDFVQLPVYEHILERLTDMYTPPTDSQLAREGASIAVRNGTTLDSLDIVAAQSLGENGFVAIPNGLADNTDYAQSVLIDYTGTSKGSSRNEIARLLNIPSENIRVEQDPNRTVDFEIILGSNYSACNSTQVLPVQ
jgi:LCP family protein required for cell wall assembly